VGRRLHVCRNNLGSINRSIDLPYELGDLLEADLSGASVLYLYLLPDGIATLRPKLE
jgi:hypothetical protein